MLRENANRNVTITGRHGFIYADNESGMVIRITGEADSIQNEFPIRSQSKVMDYEMNDIGGRQFLVPIHGEQRMATRSLQFRNIEEFRDYHKFTGDSSISFGALDQPEPPKN